MYVPLFDCIRGRLGSFGCENRVRQAESPSPRGLVRWLWQDSRHYRFVSLEVDAEGWRF